MCGIHGFCWRDQDKSIDKMISEAAHRGPDGSGSWGDDHITLGHNLLSIVDETEASSQPWLAENHVMVYNGEIYNYKALRESINYDFKTNTDTEVMLAGYAKYGKDFFHNIDGMFAVAIYNKFTKKLLLARDSNGAKPLYYGYIDNKLAFSSEISSLLSLGFDRVVSQEGLKHYLYSGMTAGPVTCFKNISRLVPGQILEIDLATGIKFSTNLNDTPVDIFTGDEKSLPSLIRLNLRKAVELTLMGRRSFGVFLSGGLDSSSIVHEMVRSFNILPNTFSTSFSYIKKSSCNEDAEIAKKMAEEYGFKNTSVEISQDDWVDNIEKAAKVLEEPRQGRSFPVYYLTNKALRKEGLTITLSGDGGDELFAGYSHYFKFNNFHKRDNAVSKNFGVFRNKSRVINVKDRFDYLMGWIPKGGLTGDRLNDFMYMDSLNTLSEDFLIRNDKLGMAFGMEARFPFMCSVFKNFVRGIPSEIKGNLPQKKLLLRSYVGHLPSFIINKKKTGWRVPTTEWTLNNLAKLGGYPSRFDEYLISAIKNPVAVDVFEIDSKKESVVKMSEKRLFSIVMFMAWYNQFEMRL